MQACVAGRTRLSNMTPSPILPAELPYFLRVNAYGFHSDRQREDHDGRCPGRHAAAVGAPRRPQSQGHQIRLRHRPVRRLHGARRRQAQSRPARRRCRPSRNATITTIEGLSADGTHPLQVAWQEIDVPQCGYCQAGQIMSAAALLAQNAEAERRRHQHGDERQPLPLRHLPAHPPGDQARRGNCRRATTQTASVAQK